MSEVLNLYRDTQIRYEKFVRYLATAQVGILPYYDMLLDQYSEADQIFVKRVLELEAESTTLTARIAELEEFKMIVEGCGFGVITEPPVLNHPERKTLKGHGTIYVPELPEPPEVQE